MAALRDIPDSQRTAGQPDPYPHKFHVTKSIPAYIAEYGEKIKNPGDRDEKEDKVAVAGRVHNVRQAGNKLRFYDLWGEGMRLQVMATEQDSADPSSFEATHDIFRRGDIIGVTGFPMRTKKGELSIAPRKIQLLAPNLHQLPRAEQIVPATEAGGEPTTRHGFKDVEQRFRQRHLDLLMNQPVRDIFVKRAKIINYVRRFLENLGFLEVGLAHHYSASV